MLTVHGRYRYFWQNLCQWCGTDDDKHFFHVQLVVFRHAIGRLRLLIIRVYLFWVLDYATLISMSHCWKVGIAINCTQTVFMLIQKQRHMLFILLDVKRLIFLDQKSLFPLFLNCKNSWLFPDPSFSFQNRYNFISELMCLALSCIESTILLRWRTDVLAWQR